MEIPSLKDILTGRIFVGHEHFSEDNQEKIAIVEIQKNKGELTIIKQYQIESSNFINGWNKKVPLALVVNTKQVIQKEVDSTDPTDGKLLHRTFPNIKWDEFYYEIWRSKTKSIVSIARRDYVDDLIKFYKTNKIPIATISLGICSLSQIENYIEGKEISTNHQTISLNQENQFLSIKISKKINTSTINGLIIPDSFVLSFCGVLKLAIRNQITSGNLLFISEKLTEDFMQDSFFKKNTKLFISFLFCALFVNFITFSYYFSKSREVSDQLLLNQSTVENLDRLKMRVIEKESKVESLLVNGSSNTSILINEIIKTTPSSITLNSLTFNPLEKKVKADEKILFDENKVIIVGNTLKNNELTSWIEKLQGLRFVKKVIITNFGKNEDNKTIFSLTLQIMDNEIK